jgi:hypothetical protein
MIAALLLQILVVEKTDAWKADLDTVQAVLASAARELWGPGKGDPDVKLRISPKGGPIVLYRRADDGALQVKLNVEDSYWAQYVFQFAHEVTHALCGVREKTHRHAWLEESLCEVGSLFALRRAAESWKKDPPYRGAAGFAPSLADYARKRLDGAVLPKDTTLPAWLKENQPAMEKTAEDRARNRVVASVLLPLFEADPTGWETLRHFPVEGGPEATLADVLAAWRLAVPEPKKPFVGRIAGALGVPLN